MNRRTLFVIPFVLANLYLGTVHADEWGCEALLCLSHPTGPTAVVECKPPIHRLWDHLRDGDYFPA